MSQRKAALVTGAGHGIGYAIAARLLSEGWAVTVAEKDETRVARARETLAPSEALRALACDVTDEAAVRNAVDATVDAFGGLDLVVCNAAIADPVTGPVESLSLAAWNLRLATNLTSAFLCAKHAVPHLRKRRGSIVNVSSTRALMSEPHTEAYAATKGGLDALTHALAVSLGPTIRVNAIRPGWIDTRDERASEPLPHAAHAQHPVGRVGRSDDVAALVLWLASDAAGFVTGQTFTVDGGMTRKMIYED